MRIVPYLLVIGAGLAAAAPLTAQTFSFVPEEVVLSDTIGAEIVFDATVSNLTQTPQTLVFVRTINLLPGLWESSMCMDVCYPSTVDTFVTTAEYGSSPLQPGESRPFSLHVYAFETAGTGTIRIVAQNARAPGDSIGILFTATALPTAVEDERGNARAFHLAQNYPNPFNGSTVIRYTLDPPVPGSRREGRGGGTRVVLAVYDVCGRLVDVLANGPAAAGEQTVSFSGTGLPSGTYYYRLEVGSECRTGKMILVR